MLVLQRNKSQINVTCRGGRTEVVGKNVYDISLTHNFHSDWQQGQFALERLMS